MRIYNLLYPRALKLYEEECSRENGEKLRADADGSVDWNARTVSTRRALTVGDSVHTTFGRRKSIEAL
jgi:hypothetical protein